MLFDKFQFYKQLDAMDCGATCLRMVAKHHGRQYSLDYLRELTFVDREGVSLMSISDAAEKLGMHSLGVKISWERLVADVPLPCIAHWKQQHFVVLYKIDAKNAWISDPAHGKHKLPKEEFLKFWASDTQNGEQVGILLLLETTPDFFVQKGEKVSRKGFSFLFGYLRNYRKEIVQLVFGLFVGSGLQLLLPFMMQSIVDVGITTKDIDFVYLILGAQLVVMLSSMSVEFIRGWILLHIGSRVNISLVSDFLAKLMRLPMRFFDTKMTGDLLQRIYDNERVERFLTSSALMTLFSVINLLVFGVVLLWFNTTIFWVFFGAALLYFGWIILFLRKRKTLDYQRFEQMSENQSALIQLISGMQEIKLHNSEKQKRWGWERIQAKLFHINVRYLALDQWQRAGATVINESKNLLISFLAARAVMRGELTLGQMLATQYLIGQMNGPLDHLVQFILQAQDASISLERMNEIHAREDEEPVSTEKTTILPENGDLMLENVSFRYGGPHDPLVLKEVNLLFPEGKTTAIVGSSGSGKTTILKLLLNFYQPQQGSVRLGDLNLENIQHKLWRSRVGVVMQDGFIFNDSIAKNIALGEELIDRKRLMRAAKSANIQQYIESLPLGYNTKVGQDGVGLSQGQKQRILIARAVYKNPEYLFFDEATNALDAFNERIIMENLGEFFRGRTVIVVAHRLSTVRDADNIIVLERGEVVEQGTHQELTWQRGTYYHLVKNQLELGA